jgi:hypothetical protein
MTREEGLRLAAAVRDALPMAMRQQLKAIHVSPKLHNGHLSLRVFMVPVTAADPEPFVFAAHEI